MPEINWTEIDEIIHKCKNTLQLAHTIEKKCQKMRKVLGEELTKIEEIILKQND